MNPNTFLTRALFTIIAGELEEPSNPLHATILQAVADKYIDPRGALETALLITLNRYADLLVTHYGSRESAREHIDEVLLMLQMDDAIAEGDHE
jgi:hypothetical protein